MHTQFLALVLSFHAFLTPVSARAEDMRLIIDRFEDSVEVFLSLPAEQVPAYLGGSTDALLTEEGRFEIGVFRQTGTAVEGDAVFGTTRLLVDGQPAGVEAMSVMVHPIDLPLPLETPIDGVAAMSICTVPDRETAPLLSELQMYGGFIAWPVDGFAPVTLELHNPEPIELWLGHFAGGLAVSAEMLSLPANAVISLPAQQVPVAKRFVAVGWALGVASAMAGAALWLARARTRRAQAEI